MWPESTPFCSNTKLIVCHGNNEEGLSWVHWDKGMQYIERFGYLSDDSHILTPCVTHQTCRKIRHMVVLVWTLLAKNDSSTNDCHHYASKHVDSAQICHFRSPDCQVYPGKDKESQINKFCILKSGVKREVKMRCKKAIWAYLLEHHCDLPNILLQNGSQDLLPILWLSGLLGLKTCCQCIQWLLWHDKAWKSFAHPHISSRDLLGSQKKTEKLP